MLWFFILYFWLDQFCSFPLPIGSHRSYYQWPMHQDFPLQREPLAIYKGLLVSAPLPLPNPKAEVTNKNCEFNNHMYKTCFTIIQISRKTSNTKLLSFLTEVFYKKVMSSLSLANIMSWHKRQLVLQSSYLRSLFQSLNLTLKFFFFFLCFF